MNCAPEGTCAQVPAWIMKNEQADNEGIFLFESNKNLYCLDARD